MPKALVRYKFRPKVIEQKAENEQAKINAKRLQKKILKRIVEGSSYEQIAEENVLSIEEAHRIAMDGIRKWAGPLKHLASDAKAIDLRRLDALLGVMQPEVFPEPYIDAESGLPTQPKPDPMFIKLYLDVLKRRAEMMGYDAAKKMDSDEQDNSLRRDYYIDGKTIDL